MGIELHTEEQNRLRTPSPFSTHASSEPSTPDDSPKQGRAQMARLLNQNPGGNLVEEMEGNDMMDDHDSIFLSHNGTHNGMNGDAYHLRRELEENNSQQPIMAGMKPQFTRFGQYEPPCVRIKNIIRQYVGDANTIGIEEISKELIQNSDDARATQVHFILDKRHLPANNVWDEWRTLQGPALCVYNNGIFTEKDIEAIQKLGVGSKGIDPNKTGQFGIGFNVVYQLTDCPSFLSNAKDVCFFDPHMKYVPGATMTTPGGHIDLREMPEFKVAYRDVLRGYLGGYVRQEGSTIFRFPFRHEHLISEISPVFYNDYSIRDMEREFQSPLFKNLCHNSLLFTKNIACIGVSVIDSDGKLKTIFEVKRKINPQMQKDLKQAYQNISDSMKLLLEGKINLEDIPKACVTYKLSTLDHSGTTDWMVNQTFGFHGTFEDEDRSYLEDFLCGDTAGKKFSPIAGVATKLGSTINRGYAFCFLQLPIDTGLPVHVNGHFAIHSSRRGLWTSTAFGDWNRVLQRYTVVPAYCSLLQTATKASNRTNVGTWYVKIMPDPLKAKDAYFQDLSRRVYKLLLELDMPVIPIIRSPNLSIQVMMNLEFHTPRESHFLAGPRNQDVERILLVLGQNVCTFPEVSLRIGNSKCKGLNYLSPIVALDCLEESAKNLTLPQNVEHTPFINAEYVKIMLEYCLQGTQYYSILEEIPLCLTADNILRIFKTPSPVFMSLEFRELLPTRADIFLQNDLAVLFNAAFANDQCPVQKLRVHHVTKYMPRDNLYIHTPEWVTLMWRLLRSQATKNSIESEIETISHLPILPGSDGNYYTLTNGKELFCLSRTGKEMQRVLYRMGLPSLEPKMVLSDDVTEHDIQILSKPFVLDASKLEDILRALARRYNSLPSVQFTEEEAEFFLQYLNSNISFLYKNPHFTEILRYIPMFETVEGDYKDISTGVTAILDDVIPIEGVSGWISQSKCTLLREKASCRELYMVLGLVKKNTVLVYIDHIFPCFAELPQELREAHLHCIKEKVIPMMNALGVQMSQQMFLNDIKKLPFIQVNGDLLCASNFFEPSLEVIGLLLDNVYPVPEQYKTRDWMEILKLAGLKTEITGEELIQCAKNLAAKLSEYDGEDEVIIGDLTDKAKMIVDEITTEKYSDDVLKSISTVAFIKLESEVYDAELWELCPPVELENTNVCLKDSLVYESHSGRDTFQHMLMTWSCLPTLPKWLHIPDKLVEKLGVHRIPRVMNVVQHCLTLLEIPQDDITDEASHALQKVMFAIYDFLNRSCDCHKKTCEDCKSVNVLRKQKCVVFNNGYTRCFPSQLVMSLPSEIDDETLQPFVYKRPQDLSKYSYLFERLGANKLPKPDMFAKVLNELRYEVGDDVLQANQKQTASSAVYGLFMTLQLDPSMKLKILPLFLPSEKAVMTPSNELIVRDNESIARKYKDNEFDYLCRLTSCNLFRKPREYIQMLPEEAQPLLLSNLVQETCAVEEECPFHEECLFIEQYKNVLHSESFIDALVAIANVPQSRKEECKERLMQLKDIELVCFNLLKWKILVKGRLVDESTPNDKYAHIESINDSCKLFLKHHEEYPGHGDLQFQLAEAIKSLVNISMDTAKITKLIRCNGEEDQMEDVVAEEGGEGMHDRDMMMGPTLGAVVHRTEQAKFNADPTNRILNKEYVGYLQYREDGTPVMTFARVVNECTKRIHGRLVPHMFKDYTIDIGTGFEVQVQALDLYQEGRRLPEINDQDVDDQHEDDEGEEDDHDDNDVVVNGNDIDVKSILENNIQEITKMLQITYSSVDWVPYREKLAKRLLRKWEVINGEKDAELATKIYDHLVQEIARLESKYEDIMVKYQELEEQKKRQSHLDQNQMTTEPDVEGGRKLFAQAQRDLPCATILKENGGFEWCCVICHEAVKKVLIATSLCHGLISSKDIASIDSISKAFSMIYRLRTRPSRLAIDIDVLKRYNADYIEAFDPMSKRYSRPEVRYTEPVADRVLDATYAILNYMAEFNYIDEHDVTLDENMNTEVLHDEKKFSSSTDRPVERYMNNNRQTMH